MNEIKKGYVPNEVYKVEQFGNTFKLIDTAGVKVGTLGYHWCKESAFNEGKAVQLLSIRMVRNPIEKFLWMCITHWLSL